MVGRSGGRRWASGVALLAVAGVAVAGCGDSSSKSSGAIGKGDLVAALTAAGGPAATAKTVTVDAEMIEDGRSEKMTGVLDFSGAVRGDVIMKPVDAADPKTPPSVHLVVDDATKYMSADSFQNSGAQFVKALGGKKWVKMQATGAQPTTAASAFGAVALESDADPVKALAALLASGLLKPDGAGHYKGTVAASGLAGSTFDAAHRAALAAVMKENSVTSEEVEVWLGADGLPAEVKFADTATGGKKSQGDVRFRNWGKPVTVTVPAPADVIEYSDFMKAAQAG